MKLAALIRPWTFVLLSVTIITTTVLLTSSCGKGLKTQPVSDSTRVYQLIQSTYTTINQKDVDTLISFLNMPRYMIFSDTIIHSIRTLLKENGKVTYALNGLGKIRSSHFDFELAGIINNLKSTGYKIHIDLEKALLLSGGAMSYDNLLKVCKIPNVDSTKLEVSDFKIPLWNILFAKRPLQTLSECLYYYSTPLVLDTLNPISFDELEMTPGSDKMMIQFLTDISINNNLLTELLAKLRIFSFAFGNNMFGMSDERAAALKIDSKQSRRGRVNALIFSLLVKMNTPTSLAYAADFRQNLDVNLRAKAKALDYSKLNNTNLLPQYFNHLHDTVVHKKIFGENDSIPPDYANLYLHYVNYVNQLMYRRGLNKVYGPMTEPPIPPTNKERLLQTYRTAISSTLTEIKIRYKFDSIAFQDSIEPYLQHHPWYPNYDNNFFSFFTFYAYLTEAVSAGIQKDSIRKGVADSTAMIIVGKEFDRKALMAFALLSAKNKTGLNTKNVSFETLDTWLDSLGRQKKEKGSLQSEVVTTFSTNKIRLSKNIPQQIKEVQVISRKYAFQEGLYYEKLRYRDQKDKTQTLEWYGTIPVSFLLPLIKTPNLLDYTDYSLAVQEFARETETLDFCRHTIDYIRLDPINALGYLFYGLSQPQTSWADIREAIVLNPVRPYESSEFRNYLSTVLNRYVPFQSPTSVRAKPWYGTMRPEVQHLIDMGMPGGVGVFLGIHVCADSADFEAQKNAYMQPLLGLLTYRSFRKINEVILDYNTNQVSETKACKSMDFLCELGLITVENRQRTEYINQGRENIAKLSQLEDYLNAWDLSNFVIDPNAQVYVRQLLINPDYKRFFGTYEIRSGGQAKFVNLEGTLSELPEELRIVIEKEPGFVSRNYLDLSGSTTGAMNKISNAVYSAFNKDYGAFSFQNLLNQTGYAYIKPWALGFAPKAPLFWSEDGKILAAEQMFVNGLLNYSMAGQLMADDSPTPEFIESVRNFWNQATGFVEQQVRENAARIIANVTQQNNDYSFAIGVVRDDQGNTSFMLDVNVKSFSIRLTSSTDLSNLQLSVAPSSAPLLAITFDLSRLFEKPTPAQIIQNDYDVKTYHGPTFQHLQFDDIPTLTAAASLVNLPPIRSQQQTIQGTSVAIVKTALPENWMSMYLRGPWVNSEEAINNKLWLHRLIIEAAPKLTDEEEKQLHDAVKTGFFPEPLVEVLAEKRKEALEEQNIRSGQWVKTDVPEKGIIPDPANRNYVTEEEYIKDFNTSNENWFENQVAEKRQKLETTKVFDEGGLPTMRLSYSKDYRYMLWTYSFRCVDGTILEKGQIFPVYVGLIEAVKKDPNGHVLEKFTSLIAEQATTSYSENNPLRRMEYQKKKEADHLKTRLDALLAETTTNLKDSIQKRINDYFDKLKAWATKVEGQKNGVETPFLPDPYGAPLLHLFPSNFQMQQRRNEFVEQLLSRQRTSELSRKLNGREIILRPAMP